MVSLTGYSVVIFSHIYLHSDRINFKTVVFLFVYWSIWTSSYNADIKVQQSFKWSLHKVKQSSCQVLFFLGHYTTPIQRYIYTHNFWSGLWWHHNLPGCSVLAGTRFHAQFSKYKSWFTTVHWKQSSLWMNWNDAKSCNNFFHAEVSLEWVSSFLNEKQKRKRGTSFNWQHWILKNEITISDANWQCLIKNYMEMF